MPPVNFFDAVCQMATNSVLFGLYDEPQPSIAPAYIIHYNQDSWIAIVKNTNNYEVTFTAIDNCITIRRADGNMDNRCDGMLTYNHNIIFVELKERSVRNNKWIPEGEDQLRITIRNFSNNADITIYNSKKAYLANNRKPLFQYSQQTRMDKFKDETGVILIIQNEIILD